MNLQVMEDSTVRGQIKTPAQLNERNRLFWEHRAQLLHKRLADVNLFSDAIEDMEEEIMRRVPIYYQRPLEMLLDRLDARYRAHKAESQKSTAREFGRKGGLAKKTDTLQALISKIVRSNPSIDVKNLVEALDSRIAEGVIEEVTDEQIFFLSKGMPKSVTRKALGARLYRAKKIISDAESR